MMRVRYRVLLHKPWWASEEDGWRLWGVVCETHAMDSYPFMGITRLGKARQVWNGIERRGKEVKIDLERAEQAFGQYADRYRLLPEIHVIEGETFQEIYRCLREQYVKVPLQTAASTQEGEWRDRDSKQSGSLAMGSTKE